MFTPSNQIKQTTNQNTSNCHQMYLLKKVFKRIHEIYTAIVQRLQRRFTTVYKRIIEF